MEIARKRCGADVGYERGAPANALSSLLSLVASILAKESYCERPCGSRASACELSAASPFYLRALRLSLAICQPVMANRVQAEVCTALT
jgi:hypothetical protein